MLFNSYEYIFLFLPLAFVIYFWLNRIRLTKGAKAWLITCSLFFYSYWNPIYLPLILTSVVVNFLVGRELTRPDGSLHLAAGPETDICFGGRL